MSGKAPVFHYGQRVRLPGETSIVTVESQTPAGDKMVMIVTDPGGELRKKLLSAEQLRQVRSVTEDGAAPPEVVLAGLWAERMMASIRSATSTVLASSVLRPYPHQMSAVYGHMLPQPKLRFLLADEPGTGKTIMSGLWLREAQRLGIVKRALVVCPAHLVQKWQADFDRFFGGGLQEITLDTVRQGLLSVSNHTTWVVSMHRAALNPTVLEAIRPDNFDLDAVIFDEAHRMTPTAETFHNVGLTLSGVEHALFLTATPHRGKEWLFQDLLHLVDPEVFPAGEPRPPGRQPRKGGHRRLEPGSVHFLRRMKESLVDYDKRRKLFKPREAKNVKVLLNSLEQDFHDRALTLVGEFFPPEARVLASIVYGKRAASSLYGLTKTLYRRLDKMGTDLSAPVGEDWYDESKEDGGEGRIVGVRSVDVKAERRAILGLLGELEPLIGPGLEVSKWEPMINDCLTPNDIIPDSDRQVVVFTEYADTADWLVARFEDSGYAARRYSGADSHLARAKTQADFRKGEFQVLVSTDAGNEGIDLQTANVLVNWDIPWSLVRLEQRLGRIHRIGQQRKVWFYNLVALGTLEGQAHEKLLDNLVKAANQLDGRIFDSLNAVMERLGITGCFDVPTGSDSGGASDQEFIRVFNELHAETEYLESEIDLDLARMARKSELLQRIEPDTVERFLDRLVTAGLITLGAVPVADQGFYYLTPVGWELPSGFRIETGGKALVTARERLRQQLIDSGNRGAERATLVTPSRPVFHQFTQAIRERTEAAMWQGAVLSDPSAQEDYTLFAYEAALQTGKENDRSEKVSWLIGVDQWGTANRVAWETLPNLTPPSDLDSKPLDPRAEAAAAVHADHLATAEAEKHKSKAEEWAGRLNRELRDLPNVATEHIPDRHARSQQRRRIEENIQKRIRQARQGADVTPTHLRRVGWAHVAGRGTVDPGDSDTVAMRHVTRLLEQEGFFVKDVHAENRGFDLLADRGAEQRCVEAKGRAGSASSEGIQLTGGELDAARLLGDDYWLYVVERCEDGVGALYDAWQNPDSIFRDNFKPVPVVRLPGSALKAARNTPNNH